MRFGAVPSDFRPATPLRTICTKFRSILPSSMTRSKTRFSTPVSSVASAAHSSVGISFMCPRSRQYTAVCAMNPTGT